jgi:hypothetical protein
VRGLPVDAEWLITWFVRQVFDSAQLTASYLRESSAGKQNAYSPAERVEFLRCLSCVVSYVLKAMDKKTPEPIAVPAPASELEFSNALLFLIAEYAHVELGITRRLAIGDYLRSLLGVETGLYLTEDLYRDHTFHMVYVCLLGDFLLQCKVRHTRDEPLGSYLYNCYESSALPQLGRQTIMQFMRRNWCVAALFHDLGYALALLGGVDKLTKYLTSPHIDAMRRSLREAYDKGTKTFCEKGEEVLGRERGFRIKRLDHGVVSALHLEHLLGEVIRDDELTTSLRPAVRAIARHNLSDSTFSVGQVSPGAGDPLQNEPLTFLLVLCDEVQEWGRVRVDPVQYREEVAAKTQFGGSSPLSALRILHYLVLNVQWRPDGFAFDGYKIAFNLIYRALTRAEESYLPISLLRTRNLQRIVLPVNARGMESVQVDVNSYWEVLDRKEKAADDLEILANYVRSAGRWELSGWLTEARATQDLVRYADPTSGPGRSFSINVNKLAGTKLLPVEPDLPDIFRWLRTYSARLSART